MGRIDFTNILKQLKDEAKDALPNFPKAFYMSITALYVAIYDDDSFTTSCSTSILENAKECFLLVYGKNNAEATWYVLYYIDEDGIPHQEGYINDKWSLYIRESRYGGTLYHNLSLCFEGLDVDNSEWLNPKDCEKALNEIIGKYLTMKKCKTIEEARLYSEVLAIKKEMIGNKNRDDFFLAKMSKEIEFYKELIEGLKN